MTVRAGAILKRSDGSGPVAGLTTRYLKGSKAPVVLEAAETTYPC